MKGSIKQRSKGTWRLRYDGPPDASGRRTQVSETVRGTKKDADTVLRERLVNIDRGTFMPKRKETVGTFLERWLEIYAASNTTLRTQQGYRGVITRYIKARGPGLHHLAFKVRNIDALLRRLHQAGHNMIDTVGRPGSRLAKIGFVHPASLGGLLVHLVEREEIPSG